MRENTDDFEKIFLNEAPLMDVRAPIEFEKGAFPTAINSPILDDSQREEVGTCYKQQGQDAAIARGYELATDEVRAARLDSWRGFCGSHPQGYLYCFRGGMRSKLTQQWLQDEGINYPLVIGGYKAMRSYLIGVIEAAAKRSIVVVGGLTGSAKGRVISDYEGGIDLEKAANHRGSTFGNHPKPQPTQINFENTLAIGLLKKKAVLHSKVLLLEDEGRAVGSLSVPLPLHQAMKKSPVVVVELDWKSRMDNLIQDYAVATLADYLQCFEEAEAWQAYGDYLKQSLGAIKKRLGLERYQQLSALLEEAIAEQQKTNDPYVHLNWLETLLKEYYDPMYQYQLEQKKTRIVMRGSHKEIEEYLLGLSS